MKTLHFQRLQKNEQGIALAIGKFDAFHIGHQSVLKTTLREYENSSLVPAVFTFRHFPVEFYLYPWEERLRFFRQASIQLCIWAEFAEISGLEAEKFLDRLLNAGVKTLVVGSDFHFGKDRAGNVNLLQKKSGNNSFKLVSLPRVEAEGSPINTSRIRTLIKKGRVEEAAQFLGRPFSITGRVIEGSKIGRDIGFPTANLEPNNNVPVAEGIYAAWVKQGNRFLKGALVIGDSPTFRQKEKKTEVFIINYKGDLYGKKLKVYITGRIREIRYFKTVKELTGQIEKDVRAIDTLLNKQGAIDEIFTKEKKR